MPSAPAAAFGHVTPCEASICVNNAAAAAKKKTQAVQAVAPAGRLARGTNFQQPKKSFVYESCICECLRAEGGRVGGCEYIDPELQAMSDTPSFASIPAVVMNANLSLRFSI